MEALGNLLQCLTTLPVEGKGKIKEKKSKKNSIYIPLTNRGSDPVRSLLFCFSRFWTNNSMLQRQELVALNAQGTSSELLQKWSHTMLQTSFLKCRLTILYLPRLFGGEHSRKCHCTCEKKDKCEKDGKVPGKADGNALWMEWEHSKKK